MKTSEILQSVLAVGKYLESNPPKPITNADRIRSMTDEELADELLEWFACFMAVEWSRDMILDLLKEEVEK